MNHEPFASGRAAPGGTGNEAERAALEAQNVSFVNAWNRHDPKALAALHTDDADSISPLHETLTGRAAIEQSFTERHSGGGSLRSSTFTKSLDSIRFPTTDIAITDATAVVTGARDPKGSEAPPATFHVTEIWKKTGGTWLIYSCRVSMKQTAPTSPTQPAPRESGARAEAQGGRGPAR